MTPSSLSWPAATVGPRPSFARRAPRLYTDFLSLLRIEGRWQIVAKTYSWTTLPAE
jgi:putative lumazine-binding protein